MVESAIVVGSTQDNGQLQRSWAVSLVMILSQERPVSQRGLIIAITNLELQWNVINHAAMFTRVPQRIVSQHHRQQLLSEK